MTQPVLEGPRWQLVPAYALSAGERLPDGLFESRGPATAATEPDTRRRDAPVP